MKIRDKEQKKCQANIGWNETETASAPETARWEPHRETEAGEELVAALRGYFLTHTLDPLTGEIYTVH